MTLKSELQSSELVLFEPRIPQNTGNIARTCAAFKIPLHLIQPLGYSLEDKYLKRAGLDYWPYMDITTHPNYKSYINKLKSNQRILAFSKSAKLHLNDITLNDHDVLIFGREDTGLPNFVKDTCTHILSIPMPGGITNVSKGGIRSLNLSSAVAIVAYQAYIQSRL